jgi:hypothetical protein
LSAAVSPRNDVKLALQALLIVLAAALIALPVWAHLSGRSSLTLPFVAVGLAALCSFLAYRGAVILRRRIDEIGARGSGPRGHDSES